ncbi:hypothetical protein LXA43DRAFT_743128 [Ganoderma leucocontextum]|nr:hypothetical protein LXA43DRAFT_743128 [Ganoderma leucocontextum]
MENSKCTQFDKEASQDRASDGEDSSEGGLRAVRKACTGPRGAQHCRLSLCGSAHQFYRFSSHTSCHCYPRITSLIAPETSNFIYLSFASDIDNRFRHNPPPPVAPPAPPAPQLEPEPEPEPAPVAAAAHAGQGICAVVQYSYDAQEDNEMDLIVGEPIELIEGDGGPVSVHTARSRAFSRRTMSRSSRWRRRHLLRLLRRRLPLRRRRLLLLRHPRWSLMQAAKLYARKYSPASRVAGQFPTSSPKRRPMPRDGRGLTDDKRQWRRAPKSRNTSRKSNSSGLKLLVLLLSAPRPKKCTTEMYLQFAYP